LGLIAAAPLLGVDERTLRWWERDDRSPIVSAYPNIIAYLGYEPWPEPSTLGEALLAERRRRGGEIRVAAELVGVDEGTWRRWERGVWKPNSVSVPKIDSLLGYSVKGRFPNDVR
jgi:transcriptional regulator with XRE-family HTH domain